MSAAVRFNTALRFFIDVAAHGERMLPGSRKFERVLQIAADWIKIVLRLLNAAVKAEG